MITKPILLLFCAALIGLGILIIVLSHELLTNLLGAGTSAFGGAVASLILAQRRFAK